MACPSHWNQRSVTSIQLDVNSSQSSVFLCSTGTGCQSIDQWINQSIELLTNQTNNQSIKSKVSPYKISKEPLPIKIQAHQTMRAGILSTLLLLNFAASNSRVACPWHRFLRQVLRQHSDGTKRWPRMIKGRIGSGPMTKWHPRRLTAGTWEFSPLEFRNIIFWTIIFRFHSNWWF